MFGHLTHDRGLAHAARAPEHRGAPAQGRIRELFDQRGFGRADRYRRYVHRIAGHVLAALHCRPPRRRVRAPRQRWDLDDGNLAQAEKQHHE